LSAGPYLFENFVLIDLRADHTDCGLRNSARRNMRTETLSVFTMG
jgi:hypothetical protein